MATQRDKIIKAQLLANRVKSIARSLRTEAKIYDVKFPNAFADELDNIANEYLKLK